jgi:hypothetical protein
MISPQTEVEAEAAAAAPRTKSAPSGRTYMMKIKMKMKLGKTFDNLEDDMFYVSINQHRVGFIFIVVTYYQLKFLNSLLSSWLNILINWFIIIILGN